jgi:non-specific serine/threonine protein kinase
MKCQLGDTVGTAYCLEALAWLGAAQQRYKRATWLLGAADSLWERAGSRLGGNAIMEEFHARAAKAARDVLGADCYETQRRIAAAHPLSQIVTLAVNGADELSPPAPDTARSRPQPPGPLTGREHEIAGLVSDGLSNREIAQRLVISKRTVDAHLEHILAKLGATSRVQIANWMGRGGGLRADGIDEVPGRRG